ncbi:hypothetical protein JCM5350_006050 [Sporobolomyces pararoseus]
MVPTFLLLKKLSKTQLQPLFKGGKEENGAVEKTWTESELKANGFMDHVVSEGWTIAIEAKWDDEYWNDPELPNVSPDRCQRPDRDPGLEDVQDAGVLVKIVSVGFFEDPNSWTKEQKEQAESLLELFCHVRYFAGAGANSNGPWLRGGKHGLMQAAGWRKATEAYFAVGSYAEQKKSGYAPKNSSGGKLGEIDFNKDSELKTLVHQMWASKFSRFYPGAFSKNVREAAEMQLPGWGDTTTLSSSILKQVFAGNLTISHSGFCNIMHKDKDVKCFTTSGCWINTVHDQMMSEGMTCPIVGGNFAMPEYSLVWDFSKCRGLCWLTWNGPETWHMTTAFENFEEVNRNGGWDRYGSSSQVAESLANVVKKYHAGDFGEEKVHGDTVRRAEAAERQETAEAKKFGKGNKVRKGKKGKK